MEEKNILKKLQPAEQIIFQMLSYDGVDLIINVRILCCNYSANVFWWRAVRIEMEAVILNAFSKE